jgi:hypothetical protein
MAALLGVPAESQPAAEPHAPADDGRIAEVIALYEARDEAATESARDRVQGWLGRRQWLAGLRVELV